MIGLFETLRGSIRLYASNWAFFTGYAGWLLLPYAGVVLAQLIPSEGLSASVAVISTIVLICLSIWISTAITHAACELREGRTPNPDTLSTQTRRVIWPMIVVGLLNTIIVLGGTLLFIIPGLVFSVWYCFAVNAAILDDKRGMDALTTSRELVRGRFWAVAWRVQGGQALILLTYYLALSLLLVIIATVTGTPIDSLVGTEPPLWSDILMTVADVFMMPLSLIYLTSVYLDAKKQQVAGSTQQAKETEIPNP